MALTAIAQILSHFLTKRNFQRKIMKVSILLTTFVLGEKPKMAAGPPGMIGRFLMT